MKIVFMGSAQVACKPLQLLQSADDMDVVALVCQPDRPKGRHLKHAACPTKEQMIASGIPVLTPDNVNAEEPVAALQALSPDLFAVVAYGQILRTAILEMPPLGCVNLHTSLLPKYRGAAPIQWAIANGEAETGVTTMYMDAGMDTGDMIAHASLPVTDEDTAGTIHDKLADIGSELLLQTLRDIAAGRAVRTPQDDRQATTARKLTKKDGRIDWTRPAIELYNRVRGFNPWPVCWCVRPMGQRETVLRVWRARPEAGSGTPGVVLDATGDGPLVATGDGALRLLELQPEGKRAMSGADYLHGHPIAMGEQLL